MRNVAGLLLGAAFFLGSMVAAFAPASAAMAIPSISPTHSAPIIQVEYFCSPGFEPRGSACVAVPSRAEIELFIDQPIYAPFPAYHRHRRHHRKGLRERF